MFFVRYTEINALSENTIYTLEKCPPAWIALLNDHVWYSPSVSSALAGGDPRENQGEHGVSEAPHATGRQVPENYEPNFQRRTYLQHAPTTGELQSNDSVYCDKEAI